LAWRRSRLAPAIRERQPDAELQLKPLSSLEQIAAVRSGQLDAGFVFTIANIDRELAQLEVASINLMLAAKTHVHQRSVVNGTFPPRKPIEERLFKSRRPELFDFVSGYPWALPASN